MAPVALFDACASGNVGAAQGLLDEGADVNATDPRDPARMTPLMEAIVHGSYGIVPMLLAAHANTAARDASGRTPILLAAQYQSLYDTIALIAHGVDVNARDNSDSTALEHLADSAASPDALKNPQFANRDDTACTIAKALIDSGATVTDDAVAIAKSKGHVSLAALLSSHVAH